MVLLEYLVQKMYYITKSDRAKRSAKIFTRIWRQNIFLSNLKKQKNQEKSVKNEEKKIKIKEKAKKIVEKAMKINEKATKLMKNR